MEGAQAFADAGAPTPVMRRGDGTVEGVLALLGLAGSAELVKLSRVAYGMAVQEGSNARQASGKDEGLDLARAAAAWVSQSIGKLEQDSGIAFHRATDVAENDDWARLDLAIAAGEVEWVAASAQAGTQGGAQVKLVAAAGELQTATAPHGQALGKDKHGSLNCDALVGRQRAEVALAQAFDGAVG